MELEEKKKKEKAASVTLLVPGTCNASKKTFSCGDQPILTLKVITLADMP